MAGVYIHVPFCKQLCTYCDFYFSVSLQRKQDMLQALLAEMELRKNEAKTIENIDTPNNFPTLYFGGGTPTVYSPEELQLLANKAIQLFLPNGISEFTVEANPDDLTPEYLQGLKQIGVNRLSIGIQSFINRDLQWMRRRHTAQQAMDSVRNAQQAGFNNITIDLIYGIPDMSLAEWETNVQQALALGVQHLSAYHLTIEPKTILGRQLQQGLLTLVDDEMSAAQYALLEELTAQAGFVHYEVSNFALPGYFSKHNSSYWQQQPYIGIGPSAHSYNGSSLRRWNVANNKHYLDTLLNGDKYYEEENLSTSDCYNEYLLTSLRTIHGTDINYIQHHFGNQLYNYLMQQAAPFIKSGRLIYKDNWLTIPSTYFLISDSVISPLFKV